METVLAIRRLAQLCLNTTHQVTMVADNKMVRTTEIANKAVKTTEVASKLVTVKEAEVDLCLAPVVRTEVESPNK